MADPEATAGRAPRTKGLVDWSVRDRFWLLWYWLRFEVSDYNYAFRRSTELRLGLPPSPQYRPSGRNRPAAQS